MVFRKNDISVLCNQIQTYPAALDRQHSACQMLSTFLVLFTRFAVWGS